MSKKTILFFLSLFGGAFIFMIAGLSSSAYAADFYVDNNGDQNDATPGDSFCATAGGFCTLRAAISEANSNPDQDNIYLDGVDGQTITLSGAIGDDTNEVGDLDILYPMLITFENNYVQNKEDVQGPRVSIEAVGLERIFDIQSNNPGEVRIALNGSQSTLRNTSYLNAEPGTGAIARALGSIQVSIEDFTILETTPALDQPEASLISVLSTGEHLVAGINFQSNIGTLINASSDVGNIAVTGVIANENTSNEGNPMFDLNASNQILVSNSDISNNTYLTYFDFGAMSGDVALFRVNLSDNEVSGSMIQDNNILEDPERVFSLGFNTIINNFGSGTGHILSLNNPNALLHGNLINWNQVLEMCEPGSEDFLSEYNIRPSTGYTNCTPINASGSDLTNVIPSDVNSVVLPITSEYYFGTMNGYLPVDGSRLIDYLPLNDEYCESTIFDEMFYFVPIGGSCDIGAVEADNSVTDLIVTKTNGVTTQNPGESTTYTITVVNDGVNNLSGVNIADAIPAGLENVKWTCTAVGLSSCSSTSGTGSVDITATLYPQNAVTLVVSGTLSATYSEQSITNTASLVLPTQSSITMVDTNPDDNTAVDTDLVNLVELPDTSSNLTGYLLFGLASVATGAYTLLRKES